MKPASRTPKTKATQLAKSNDDAPTPRAVTARPAQPTDMARYRRLLRRGIPVKERAAAWAQLIRQDKNLIAKLRALELVDELCGYSAPKGAVMEAPIFHLGIATQVSVIPPELAASEPIPPVDTGQNDRER